MGLLARWRNIPGEFPVTGLPFLREQDGKPERRLKNDIAIILKRKVAIERAYLVQVINRDEAGVALCIKSRSDQADMELVRQVGRIFAQQFNAREHLDILF